MTMFSLFTSFSARYRTAKEYSINEPALLQMDEHGIVILPKRFRIGELVYSVNRTEVVLNLSPHVPMNDDDERSCYAILLLHNPWPNGNEDDILGSPPKTAVECLNQIKSRNMFPNHVKAFITRTTMSEHIMDLQGEPDTGVLA